MDNEFSSTAKPTTIKESVRTLVDQGSETVETIKARIGGVTEQVKQGGTAAFGGTRSFIEAHPLKGVAIAFGVGYIAMRIKTSPVLKLALLAGVGYVGSIFLKR